MANNEKKKHEKQSSNNQALENKSLEELHKQIEKGKRKISRSIVFAIAALIAIIAIGVAWFVSNTRVQFTGMSVSADMKKIELKTYGSSAGIHDDLLKILMDKDNTWYEKIEAAARGFLETSPEKYAVNWLLSDTSNMGNYSASPPSGGWADYWKNSNNKRQDQAIEPGSSGKLQFSVVPKQDGAVTLDMQLSVIPYSYNSSDFKEADDTTKNFVYGHILFFLEKSNASASESNALEENSSQETEKTVIWLDDGSFSISIPDAKKDSEYSYTLYWCWPQAFAEITLAKGDGFLNQREPLLSQYTNGEGIRRGIACGSDSSDDASVGKYSMVTAPQRYFYSNLTHSALLTNQPELEKISMIYGKFSNNMGEDEKNAFVDLSSYYNQADQYIGSHANCLRVKLEMQPIFGEKD